LPLYIVIVPKILLNSEIIIIEMSVFSKNRNDPGPAALEEDARKLICDLPVISQPVFSDGPANL